MKRHPSMATLLLVMGPALSLHAQITDAVWLNAHRQMSSINNLVASDVSAHIEIFDGDGKNIDTVNKKTQLTGWKNGEPIRTVTSLTETQKSPLGDAKLDFGLADHPDKDFSEILTANRVEETSLDSKSCFLFQVSGKKKNKVPFTGKVWIEKSSGLPLKAEYVYDPSSIPMTKSMNYSVEYGRGNGGVWLPKIVSINVLMSMMFVKVRMVIQQNLDVWIPRP
jgi:hypothetical protein